MSMYGSHKLDRDLAEKMAATAGMNIVDHHVIGNILDELIRSLQGDITVADIKIFKQMRELQKTIDMAKIELSQLAPVDLTAEHLPGAADQLEEIVRATEEATGKILDAAETVQNIAETVDEKNKQRLVEAATSIFEASNFQDITGQRITKVVKTMQIIEDRLQGMVEVLGGEIKGSLRGKLNNETKNENATNTLMSGPQLPGKGVSQDDIDTLFNSL
ncbi:MAG: protein phosphatase CheZ [Holosporales bacterium]